MKFLSRGRTYTLFLNPTEAVPAFIKPGERENTVGTVLSMKLVGANPLPHVEGLEELPGKVNYLLHRG